MGRALDGSRLRATGLGRFQVPWNADCRDNAMGPMKDEVAAVATIKRPKRRNTRSEVRQGYLAQGLRYSLRLEI